MKKTALFLLVLLLILSLQAASLAADTRTQSGKATTVGHFRMFAPDGNDLESGRPLIVFFATSQQPKVDKVLGLVNKYGMYDDFDANIICMAIAGNYAQGKWPQAVKDLADYLQPSYETRPFDIVIDCVGNGGYAGCCLAQELQGRGITPKELNLGDGADPKTVTKGTIEKIIQNGTKVCLFAGSTDTDIAKNSRNMIDQLAGTENFRGVLLEDTKTAATIAKAISEYGLHEEYTCWDMMPLQQYTASNGTTVRYCVYIPEAEDPNPEDKLPVVIYFHGVKDTLGKLHGLGQLIRTKQVIPRGIVLLPQALDGTSDMDFNRGPYQKAVLELVQKLAEEHNGDLNRLSVSGHSNGGTAAYHFVNNRPGTFAACVPISGVGSTDEGVKQTYLWVFQGANDSWVKPNVGLRVAVKCEAAGCHAMHYVFKDMGHGIQDRVFLETFTDEDGNETRILDWMMEKELQQ